MLVLASIIIVVSADSFVKVSGKSYKARLKNSGWSLYTYYTTGIWYVSV